MDRARGCPVAFLTVLFFLIVGGVSSLNPLSYDYYKTSCPQLESIIAEKSYALYKIHGNFATSSMRNLFHDCAVGTCDASVLIRTTPQNSAEEDSEKNIGLRNFKYFEVLKKAVEAACPKTVSCADILMLAGREGVHNLKGPYISMKLGRYDAKVSSVKLADTSLVARNASITEVLQRFSELGVNAEQAVALIGAHSVGRVHCANLVERLYPQPVATLDAVYANYLSIKRCPKAEPSAYNSKDPEYSRFDPDTPMVLDNSFYRTLQANRALLTTDQNLASDPRTKSFVDKFATDNDYFHAKFSEGVQALTNAQPLNAEEGEIRMHCDRIN